MASALNMLGMSIAFAVFLIITISVRFEYGFDRFHKNKGHIFQLENMRDDKIWESNFSRPHIEALIASSPHIVAGGVYMDASAYSLAFSADEDPDAPGFLDSFIRVTSGFTDVFDFDMTQGSSEALREPDKILIPESLSKKLFGNEPAVGRTLYFAEARALGKSLQFHHMSINTAPVIGGVFRDFPENSRLRNVIYMPIPEAEMMNDPYTGSYYGYVRLDDPLAIDQIVADFKSHYSAQLADMRVDDIRLRPIEELYFSGNIRNDNTPTGNRQTTDMLLLVAFLVVAIASINYVNFSIALTPVRIRNINTRKIMGQPVSSIRGNLVMESALICVCAFVISAFVVWLIHENGLLEKLLGYNISMNSNIPLFALTGVLSLAVGVLAGLYPAWHMTSFPPAMVANGSFSVTSRAKLVRKSLIGFQYIVSIALIICALFVNIQNKYIRSFPLGFDKENVLEVRLPLSVAALKTETYRQRLMSHSDIKGVGFTDTPFVSDESRSFIAYYYNGERHYQHWIGVSYEMPEVMGLQIVEGRGFCPGDELRDDDLAVCIINQTAANEIGAVVGEYIYENRTNVEIVGIYEDINFKSLYNPVGPFAYYTSAPGKYRRSSPELYSYIRISPHDPQASIDHIRNVLAELEPSYPAEIIYIDQSIANLYQKSLKQAMMITIFSLIAVILSVIGVFGLVVFEAQGRRKEIAIRKVMGASVREILIMLNGGFARIVLICFIIAGPLAWYGVRMWLKSFAYATPVHIWVFFAALCLVMLLTLFTVTFQSYRAAVENPAEAIKRG